MTELDYPAIERAAIDAVLDKLKEAIESLPSEPWNIQHDHPKTAGPVDRAAVLAAIESVR